jgi:hypothetical protein
MELENDEVLVRVAWVKLVVAGAAGMIAGLLGLQGVLVILCFLLLSNAASFYYVSKVLELDDEDVGRTAILQEGWQSLFAFLLSWILAFQLTL